MFFKRDENREPRIYILPTKFGAVFIFSSFLMILIGSGFQNNLVNMLAYFMMSLIFIAMIQTNFNLKNVRVTGLETEGGFAGREFLVTTVLANSSQSPRFELETRLKKRKPKFIYTASGPVLGNSVLKIKASYPSPQRGRLHFTRVKFSTVYPIGLFRAWGWMDVKADVPIYPEPKGNRALPVALGQGHELFRSKWHQKGDDFLGHRPFQKTDSPRHVDWKAHARGRPLLVKDFRDGSRNGVILDWNSLEGLNTETRLSQLAKWIEEAKKHKLPFGLNIPGCKFPIDQGPLHVKRCMEALADFSYE